MKARVPSYRLHRPSGKGVATLGGRDFYFPGKYGSKESKAAYDRLVGEWLANGRRLPRPAGHAPDHGPSIAELVVKFMAYAEGYYRKNGRETSEVSGFRLACRPLVEMFAELPAQDYSPAALKVCRDWFVEQGISRPYSNKQTTRIRAVFKWGVEEELVPSGILAALKAVRPLKEGRTTARETDPVLPIEEATVEKTIPHMARQVAAMVRLQLLTGARPGEVCVLRTGDVDRSGKVWVFSPMTHKTEHHGKARTIAIGPAGQELLRPWWKADPLAFVFSPQEAEEERNASRRAARKSPMTPSQAARTKKRRPKRTAGDRYTVDSYRRAIERACDAAFPPPEGLVGQELVAWLQEHRWAPNRLRHTFGTRVRREHGLEAAQVLLGHSSCDVTQVYAERNEALALQVAEKIG
jgi:integrase